MQSYNARTTEVAGHGRRTVAEGPVIERGGHPGLSYDPPKTNDRKMTYVSTGDQVCLEVPTVFDVVNYMKSTNCPFCKIPVNFPGNHHTQNCPHAKELGLEIKYVSANDKH